MNTPPTPKDPEDNKDDSNELGIFNELYNAVADPSQPVAQGEVLEIKEARKLLKKVFEQKVGRRAFNALNLDSIIDAATAGIQNKAEDPNATFMDVVEHAAHSTQPKNVLQHLETEIPGYSDALDELADTPLVNIEEIKEAVRHHLDKGGKALFGKQTIRNDRQEQMGRNDLCPCGSGKKFKRCCMRKKAK